MKVWLPSGLSRALRRSWVWAWVDAEDYELVTQHRWRLAGEGYPVTRIAGKTVYLHRYVMGVSDKRLVDHIDGDTLNCRKAFLRILSSQRENAQNVRVSRRRRKRKSCPFRGVSWRERDQKWRASASLDGKDYHGGVFADPYDAAEAAEALRQKLMPYAMPDPALIKARAERASQAQAQGQSTAAPLPDLQPAI